MLHDIMIDSKELRIGNLLEVDGNYWPVNSIVTIDKDRFELYLSDVDYDYALYAEPISITEEWLLKFGFEKVGERVWRFQDLGYSEEAKHVSRKWESDEEIDPKYLGWLPCANGIVYVHQLQNLYFALTGTELTIK